MQSDDYDAYLVRSADVKYQDQAVLLVHAGIFWGTESSKLSALALEFGGCPIDAAGQCLGLFNSAHLAWVVESQLSLNSKVPLISQRNVQSRLLDNA